MEGTELRETQDPLDCRVCPLPARPVLQEPPERMDSPDPPESEEVTVLPDVPALKETPAELVTPVPEEATETPELREHLVLQEPRENPADL